MAKKTNGTVKHVKIAKQLRRAMEGHLEEGNKVVDVHFRAEPGVGGPPGWNVIVERTVLGQPSTHGLNFPTLGRPDSRSIWAGAKEAVKVLDKKVNKESLIVKPGEVPSGLRG